jgi:hypothetical protein
MLEPHPSRDLAAEFKFGRRKTDSNTRAVKMVVCSHLNLFHFSMFGGFSRPALFYPYGMRTVLFYLNPKRPQECPCAPWLLLRKGSKTWLVVRLLASSNIQYVSRCSYL